jgi:hypothetical protein
MTIFLSIYLTTFLFTFNGLFLYKFLILKLRKRWSGAALEFKTVRHCLLCVYSAACNHFTVQLEILQHWFNTWCIYFLFGVSNQSVLTFSCNMKLNLDYLLEIVWENLALVRVYTKKRGGRKGSQSYWWKTSIITTNFCHWRFYRNILATHFVLIWTHFHDL